MRSWMADIETDQCARNIKILIKVIKILKMNYKTN